MTEITQADRDAAGEVFEALLVATETILMTPDECEQIILQAFARHRMEERAAIVAWLRAQDDPSEKWSLQNSHWYAAEIEAGEHLG